MRVLLAKLRITPKSRSAEVPIHREFAIDAIHCRTSATPSSCTNRLPSSGIMTPGWVDAIRYAMMDLSGWPGTISYSRPPEPRPAATGTL